MDLYGITGKFGLRKKMENREYQATSFEEAIEMAQGEGLLIIMKDGRVSTRKNPGIVYEIKLKNKDD